LPERLEAPPYAGAAGVPDRFWGESGTVFPAFVDDIEVVDAEWTRETVLELAEQWQRAESILNGIDALASLLEADPPKRFSRLVDAALGRDAHLEYQRMRRLHAYEITEAGLVPIDHTGDSVALPLDATG